MANIEQLEIHSKSYLVRWIKVDEGHTISWSVKPFKKSINFGIVKHPGSGAAGFGKHAEETRVVDGQTDGLGDGKAGGGVFGKRDASTAQEQLSKKGFIPTFWHGRCEADQVSMGTYSVSSGNGGDFGMVFDNTFSKQTSKTAAFVLLTYPTGAPPLTAPNLRSLQSGPAGASKISQGKQQRSPRLGAASESVDSLNSHVAGTRSRACSTAGRSEGGALSSSSYHVGTLLKRRRKKGQGYARRFFSLDYTTCTLSYYHSRSSSVLRGAIPLSLAAIVADEKRRGISIDSGAEIWHLKASHVRDFTDWAQALERASRIARSVKTVQSVLTAPKMLRVLPQSCPLAVRTTQTATNLEEDREWELVEALVSRIVGTRDALRRLVKDLAAQKDAHLAHVPIVPFPTSPSQPDENDQGYFPSMQTARRPFFCKRKSSAASSPLTPQNFPPVLSSALAVPTPSTAASMTPHGRSARARSKSLVAGGGHGSPHEHCSALLSDLDSVIAEFSHVLTSSKRRRMPVPLSAVPRHSYESTSTEEFFDAEAGDTSNDRPQLMLIDHRSEEDTPASDVDEVMIHDSSSMSSAEDANDGEEEGATADLRSALFPPKPKSLSPLPITAAVTRRTGIPPAVVAPPSLIAFVRKNVGKDLTSISMPVTSNEPTSLLQRMAEQFEYAQLLDAAAQQTQASDRLLYVTAFAVSQFSINRAKERAMRKPFNPLLGETYELVRSGAEVPGGFRLLVEKVCHRPVRMAMQADGAAWSFAQNPAPSQKFWGKSAEVTTEGRVRLNLRLPGGTDELYSWAIANMFLRNVVMGEKYTEPVGTMHVVNDSTGAKAAIEFRSRGMFGGRSEAVHVSCFGPEGQPTAVSLAGTWTGGLKTVPNGDEIWRPGSLVDNAASTYGMTTFAASLNEMTVLEKDKLPPTDSRLRPDQRLVEQGKVEEAEGLKAKLEDAQRQRRKAQEERGEEHRPRWFVKVAGSQDGGEEVWRLKTGKDGYWEERGRGTWAGVEEIFQA